MFLYCSILSCQPSSKYGEGRALLSLQTCMDIIKTLDAWDGNDYPESIVYTEEFPKRCHSASNCFNTVIQVV
jgi:hypothetical protein